MVHLYAVLHRSPQVSNKPLRLDDMSDDELLLTTRFTRSAVDELLSYVEDDLQRPTYRAHALPPDSQLIAALQFYASGSFQWIVGRSCRMSQPSVSIAVEAVTNSLNKLAPRYIRFPTDQPTVVANKLSFHAVAGFPNVLGAIDGTARTLRFTQYLHQRRIYQQIVIDCKK